MLDKLVEGIYNNIINILLSKVDSYQEELKIDYKKYLYTKYALVTGEPEELEELIIVCSEMELNKWKTSDKNTILTAIIEDTNFEQLTYLSQAAYKHAQRKIVASMTGQPYTPELSEEQVKSYIEQMELYKEKVLPFNASRAEIYLSEGIMDLNYSINLTEHTSLRVARMR